MSGINMVTSLHQTRRTVILLHAWVYSERQHKQQTIWVEECSAVASNMWPFMTHVCEVLFVREHCGISSTTLLETPGASYHPGVAFIKTRLSQYILGIENILAKDQKRNGIMRIERLFHTCLEHQSLDVEGHKHHTVHILLKEWKELGKIHNFSNICRKNKRTIKCIIDYRPTFL